MKLSPIIMGITRRLEVSDSEYVGPSGSLPIGTRIRFLKTLEAGPNEDQPAP